ncbi:MAG: MBL fold metallo-hydrolase [Brevirhabdus sp.]
MLRILALLPLLIANGAIAQDRKPSHCLAFAQANPGFEFVHLAGFRDPLPADAVRINYIAHATFLLQTPGGLSAATDFTGFLGSANFTPDVVTMNHAHETHWTAFPDPAIPHVLKGWGENGKPAVHHLDLGEMLVRNVSTDIRSGFDSVETNGNSIFIFEVAGLCIGHLGHLHHEPDAAQYAAIGRLDVVMAAVDGGTTLDLHTMLKVLRRIKASVVIPMHWFGDYTLEDFLDGISRDFDVVKVGAPSIELSFDKLPSRPTVMVLHPVFLRDPQ